MNPSSQTIAKLTAGFVLLAGLCHADPLFVTQGLASQRAGTRLVDVSYDLSGGVPPYSVTLQGSIDGGVTWTLPVATVSGNVGSVATAGTNRLVTWDAGIDWNGQVSGNVKFRVNVTDSATSIYGEMVRIEGGSFQMGDQSNPLVGASSELPVHTVQVSTFYMGKYEVSWGLWKLVRDWARQPGRGYADLPDGLGKADDHPVVSINWNAMVKWCNARTEYENATLGTTATPCYSVNGVVYRTDISTPVCNFAANGYRLPTEAEWEKSARGGQTGYNFPWGNDINHDNANYRANSSAYNYDTSGYTTYTYHPTYYTAGDWPYTAPVNSFTPNGYGLFNISGNVFERCWDWYNSGYYSNPTAGDNPRGPSPGSNRVVRGGSFAEYTPSCRVASRWGSDTAGTPGNGGFRLARSSVP